MTQLIAVKRIPVPVAGPFSYADAKVEVDRALASGADVQVEGRDIVIRTRVAVKERGLA